MKKIVFLVISFLVLSFISLIILLIISQNILNTSFAKNKINEFLNENYEMYVTYDNISIRYFKGLFIDNFKSYKINDELIFMIDKMHLPYKIRPLFSKILKGNLILNNFNLKNEQNDISTNGELTINLNNNEIHFNMNLVSKNFNIEEFHKFITEILELIPEADEKSEIEEADETDEFIFDEQFIIHTDIKAELQNIYYPEYFKTSFKGNINLNPIIIPPQKNDNSSTGKINLRMPSVIINNNKEFKKIFSKLKMDKYEKKDNFKTDAVSLAISLEEGNFFIEKNEVKIDNITFLLDGKIHITGNGGLNFKDKESKTDIIYCNFEDWILKNWGYNENYLFELLKKEAMLKIDKEKDKLIEKGIELLDEKLLKNKGKLNELLNQSDESDLKEKIDDYIDTEKIENLKEKASDYIDSGQLEKIESKVEEIIKDEEFKEKAEKELNRFLKRLR